MKENTLNLLSEYPDVMSVHDIRQALGIGRKGAYQLLESGAIRSFRIGNVYKIPKSALLDYIERSCEGGRKV